MFDVEYRVLRPMVITYPPSMNHIYYGVITDFSLVKHQSSILNSLSSMALDLVI